MNVEEYLQELDELISAAPEVINVEILRVYRVETSTDRTQMTQMTRIFTDMKE